MRVSRRRALQLGAAGASLLAGWRVFHRSPSVVADIVTGIGFFAYDIEGNDQPLTEAAAIARAGQFDLIVAQKAMYRTLWPKMLAANPKAVWAVYTNGTHTNSAPPHFAHDWYLWDAQGKPVTSQAFPGNYLLNPLSGAKAFKENAAVTLMRDSGANALYVDELGVGPIYSVSAPPIDPRTNEPWTWADWMIQMNRLLDGYAAKITQPIYCNGLGNGNRYFTAPTSSLLDHSRAALAESFIRGSGQPASY